MASFLGACGGTPKVEVPRDAAGNPLPVTVEVLDLRGGHRWALSNRADRRLVAAEWAGRLPPWHKLVPNRRMGELLAFMRARGFFRYAAQVSERAAEWPPGTRRVVRCRIGKRHYRLLDIRGMGLAGRGEEVRVVRDVATAVWQISNETLALRVDPRGRGVEELLRQPALRRAAPRTR